MYYLINDTGTTIQVPDWQRIYYKDLTLIGKKTTDWNEPIQENFLKIVDRIERLERTLYIPNCETSTSIGLLDFTNTETEMYLVKSSDTVNTSIGLLDFTNTETEMYLVKSSDTVNTSIGLLDFTNTETEMYLVKSSDTVNTSIGLLDFAT